MTDKTVRPLKWFINRLEACFIQIYIGGRHAPVVAMARGFPGFISRSCIATMALATGFGTTRPRHRVIVMTMAGSAIATTAISVDSANSVIWPGVIKRSTTLHAQIVTMTNGTALFKKGGRLGS